MSFFVALVAKLGDLLANVGTTGCYIIFVDEPKMPKHLIEK